jgi:uncharacterized SAM-dependent methyltransferase
MNSPRETASARDAAGTPPRQTRRSAALAAELHDGLVRPHRELPRRLLDEPAVADVRRMLESIGNDRLRVVEVPVLRRVAEKVRAQCVVRRVVEFAPGGSSSVMALLDSAPAQAPVQMYLAVDASLDIATEAAHRVASMHPGVAAASRSTDAARGLAIQQASGTIFACLGRALSQLSPVHAIRMLRGIRAAMTRDDRLLISLDRRSAASRIDAANAHAELRGAWHRYALAATSRDLGAYFPQDHFRYAPWHDADNRCLAEGLECLRETRIDFYDFDAITLRVGERIRTSVDGLYDRTSLEAMLLGVGLMVELSSVSADGMHEIVSATLRHHSDVLP